MAHHSLSFQEGLQNSSPTTGEKGEDLIRVLRELTTVQRKIADLQVELQGRKVSLRHSSCLHSKTNGFFWCFILTNICIRILRFVKFLGWQKCCTFDSCEWNGKEDWDIGKDYYYTQRCYSEQGNIRFVPFSYHCLSVSESYFLGLVHYSSYLSIEGSKGSSDEIPWTSQERLT